MASTTTIRLPDALKARVARAVADAGTTAHSFILEAIAEKASEHELRSDFQAVAAQRYDKFMADGKTIPWAEVRAYLEARAVGKAPQRPQSRRFGKSG